MQLFDWDAFEEFAEPAVVHYRESAPTVSRYLDDLYIRVRTGEGAPVLLDEILTVQRLYESEQYLEPNHAANLIYKLMSRLGMDTTGHAGF